MRDDSQEFIARIGVVVHGPEIIDSGCALQLINYLKKLGSVTAVLGGTMGRVAVIDAGLEDVISIRPRRRPSHSIQDLEAKSDVIFLLNQAKSRESGLVFGTMVAAAAGMGKPLIQIDCGGRFVAILSGKEGDLAVQVASDLGLDSLLNPPLPGVSFGKDTTKRSLSGVCPGELISINGIVIGRAAESRVEIEAKDGRIMAMKGVKPKQHGLEKLSWVDLEKAIIRSGSIRRSEVRPRLGACGRGTRAKANGQFSSITVRKMPLRWHREPVWPSRWETIPHSLPEISWPGWVYPLSVSWMEIWTVWPVAPQYCREALSFGSSRGTMIWWAGE